MYEKPVWITWEHQRRSVVLAQEFGASFQEMQTNKTGLFRYLVLSLKTLRLLNQRRPRLLFIQNPSIVLTVLACYYKALFPNTTLVVDRHSNFFPVRRPAIINFLLKKLSDVTLRHADLTIITNEYLKNLVDSIGGNAAVLEDKIPELHKTEDLKLAGSYNILYICSFSYDEPYEEVFQAATLLSPDINIYVTGNYHRVKNSELIKSPPKNLHFLGYLPEGEYINYLCNVDLVMVLTTWDHTLLCGAYEAVAVEKPLILSNKKDLLSYFCQGVVSTENDTSSIANAIEKAVKEKDTLRKNIKLLKKEVTEKWTMKFNEINKTIKQLQSSF